MKSSEKIKIVREMSRILGVGENDITKTLQRLKDDIAEMEKELKDVPYYQPHK